MHNSYAMNRKIRNASKTVVDNITMRSKSEVMMYNLLKENNFNFQYEPLKIILLEGFQPGNWLKGDKIHSYKERAVTYTPDFVVYENDCIYLIEVKGFPNDVYPLKRKLLLKWIEEQSLRYFFLEVHDVSDMKKCIKIISDEKSCRKNH